MYLHLFTYKLFVFKTPAILRYFHHRDRSVLLGSFYVKVVVWFSRRKSSDCKIVRSRRATTKILQCDWTLISYYNIDLLVI